MGRVPMVTLPTPLIERGVAENAHLFRQGWCDLAARGPGLNIFLEPPPDVLCSPVMLAQWPFVHLLYAGSCSGHGVCQNKRPRHNTEVFAPLQEEVGGATQHGLNNFLISGENSH